MLQEYIFVEHIIYSKHCPGVSGSVQKDYMEAPVTQKEKYNKEVMV